MNRYYVIINGINSLTIPGLAIKELPPITKTLMRNQREEIDGRDGDITTELGYSAYDKTMTIGLYGSYDINNIIAFFNQKGTIVFSDEPDKYYNFTILEKIDYDKLVKFRTATVKMHIQPFKYPVSETPVEIEAEYVTATGEDITLNDTTTVPLEIGLKGNTSQEGTPTPDTPQPVQVVTGDNTIRVVGKNLFSGFRTIGANATYENGILSISAGGSGANCTSNYFVPSGNRTYYFSYNSSYATARYYIVEYDSNYTQISSTSKTTQTSFTISNNASYFSIIWNFASGTTFPLTISNMQLELGNTATDYTPYQSQEYEINLGSLELCKIGTYQDYLYKSGENWYKHKEIGKVILDGTIGGYNSGNNWFYIGLSNLGITSANALVCNYFKFYEDFTSLVNTTIGIGLSNNLTNFLIRNTALTSENDYKTWLGNNNTIVYYALATPTEEQITDEALITQLELLQNAMSYLDQTNVTQAYDNMPFILVLNAIKKGTNEITINNIGNIYSKPIMALNGSGMIKININDTEVLRVDMSEHHNIVIDSANMEAYNPNTMALRNRQVTGNYENLKLNQGENKIKVLGQLTEATITDYTRWL